jgi:aryl-alcohol dehydrogenase-like predicted oxidoreductase
MPRNVVAARSVRYASGMVPRMQFGSTGHESSRTLFGAAALAAMSESRAETVLETLLEFGINHIDTAASYGDAELRLAPWLRTHRKRFFLASKTRDRSAAKARESLHRSLERMGVDQLDLIQMHNLVDEPGWQTATGPGGALQALIDARDEGLVRFIGVTGHGTYAPAMHLRSLEAFPFDSVLAPYNFTMMAQPEYASDFERLAEMCAERKIALQTITSIARRRWVGVGGRRFSWYEPMSDEDALRRGVQWVLSRPDIFLNTSSDGTLLRATLEAASTDADRPPDESMQGDVTRLGIEPLFVRGVSDTL